MGRLLGAPVPLAPWTLRCGSRVTQRWRRDGFDGYAPAMAGHLVAAYHSAQACAWQLGATRLAGALRPGTITLIPDAHDGTWQLAGPVEVAHVYLATHRLQACADELAGGRRIELRPRVGSEDPITTQLIGMLAGEAELSDAASSLFVEQAVDLLCLHLVRRHAASPAAAATPRRGLARWQVERVAGYLREHLASAVDLAELAGVVGLSKFHFCAAFRRATGETPHAALTRLRIARARELLADPALQVTDVALAVGYHTPSAFAATFRRLVGVSPSAYRHRR